MSGSVLDRRHATPSATLSPAMQRAVLLACVIAAAGCAFLVGTPSSVQQAADADLARLLRMMAVLKMAFAVPMIAAVLWRLAESIGAVRFLLYAGGCAAMFAGPVLIWQLSYVGAGALLLHGGLVATLLLLWRDPAITARLDRILHARRHASR